MRPRPASRFASAQTTRQSQRRFRPRMEPLEDRTAPSVGWAIGMSGNDWNYNNGLAVSAQGDSYITGNFSGSTDFDPGPSAAVLTSAGGPDVYVAKYTSSGALGWAKRFGGANGDGGSHIVTDVSGNL